MTLGPMALALVLRLSPVTLAHWAAWATGQPEAVAERLVGVCYRETRCRPHRLHELDEHIGPRAWAGQVRLEHLNPDCQPRELAGRWLKWDWSTRGAFGLQAASHWQFLPACYSPKLLDHTLVSALVAARKWAGVGVRKRCPTEAEFTRRRRKDPSTRVRLGWCAARRRGLDLSIR